MFSLTTQAKTIVHAIAAFLVFATASAAQIPGLCDTGQTQATATGCTGVLVTPNPQGGGPNRDGNWELAYPYPSTLSPSDSPCSLTGFTKAWVDTPNASWLHNSASEASEWITIYNGEGYYPLPGWYVYRTAFHVPSVLPSGVVPTSLTINGRLTSDNATYALFMAGSANGGSCAVVSGLPIPIDPDGGPQFADWWDVSFKPKPKPKPRKTFL